MSKTHSSYLSFWLQTDIDWIFQMRYCKLKWLEGFESYRLPKLVDPMMHTQNYNSCNLPFQYCSFSMTYESSMIPEFERKIRAKWGYSFKFLAIFLPPFWEECWHLPVLFSSFFLNSSYQKSNVVTSKI